MGRAPGAVPEHVDRSIREAVMGGAAVERGVPVQSAVQRPVQSPLQSDPGPRVGGRERLGSGWRIGGGWRIAASIAMLIGASAGWFGGSGSAPPTNGASELKRSSPAIASRDVADMPGSSDASDMTRSAPRDSHRSAHRDATLAADRARPTVVDAMLAARIAAGANLNLAAHRLAQLDVDGSGGIDDRDVRLLLRRAVDVATVPSIPSPPSAPSTRDQTRTTPHAAGERGAT